MTPNKRTVRFSALRTLGIHVAICSAIVAAPMSKLLAFNAPYFGISGLELLVTALLAGTLAALFSLVILWIISLGRPGRLNSAEAANRSPASSLYILLSLLLASSILFSFVIPVSLPPLDGPTGFTIRREALYGALAVLLIFAAILAIRAGMPAAYDRIFHACERLTPFGVLYAAAFTLYSLLNVPLLGFSGKVESTAGFVLGDRNIFVLSFDQVQGSFVHNMIRAEPEIASSLHGFTLYPDAASTYPNTSYSLASLLLGRPSENSRESLKEAIQSPESLLAAASSAGATVYTNDPSKSENPYECLTCSDQRIFNREKTYELLRHALNLGFGVDVHQPVLANALERWGVIRSSDGLQEHAWKHDLHRFKTLTGRMVRGPSGTNLFFMHFVGSHQPFTYDRKCSIIEASRVSGLQNSRGAEEVARCVLGLLAGFVQELKALDAFDDSTILFVSDHGYEALIQKSPPHLDYFPHTADEVGDLRNIKPAGSYNPLFLFKPAGATNAFHIDTAPVSLIDIAPTVCAILRCDRDYAWGGYDLASLDPPTTRKREFWQYLGTSDRRTADGRDKFHGGLDEFWERRAFVGELFPHLAIAMGLDHRRANRLLRVGEVIAFDRSGDSRSYTKGGWHAPEATHRWTNGERAELALRLDEPPAGDLILRASMFPFLGGRLTEQDVSVIVNGKQVETWRVTKDGKYSARIPSSLVRRQALDIKLGIASPLAPCETGPAKDCRRLGVALKDLTITVAEDM